VTGGLILDKPLNYLKKQYFLPVFLQPGKSGTGIALYNADRRKSEESIKANLIKGALKHITLLKVII
jgi:hypothetical protein